MATIAQHAPGTFCWPELATTDQAAAKGFYTKLFGWNLREQEIGGGETYAMFQLGGRDTCAAYSMGKEERAANIPPHWNSYVAVTSADQAAEKAKALGGTVMVEPFDVFEHGRMAVIQDPTGAVVCVWQAKNHPGAGVLGENNSLCWTELMTSDAVKAGPFYSGLFGWKAEAKAMGPMVYTTFKNGELPAAGMMQITPDMGPIPSYWNVYFAVADCDAIVAKATELGGCAIMGPHEVPGIGRFAILKDPQGAVFSVIKLAAM